MLFESRVNSIDLVMIALSAEFTQVLRFFRPDESSIVVDVGANIGGYAIRLARSAQHVIAIEPEPGNFAQLVSHIELNRLNNVTPLNVAVSDRRGRGVLHISQQSGGHSLETRAWTPGTGISVDVETILLDDVVERHRLLKIDWLKIDVERHELAVLNGADRALSMTRNLILEFDIAELAGIESLLSRHGLRIRWYDAGSENSSLIATTA